MRKLICLAVAAQLVLVACAHQPEAHMNVMERPIAYDSSSQFYRELQALQGEMSEENYMRLTDAIGNLQAHDLENLSYEDFHASLAGLSPNQIIQKSDRMCQEADC